jgi:hypothetical protein
MPTTHETEVEESVSTIRKDSADLLQQVSRYTTDTLKKPTSIAAAAGAVAMGAVMTFGLFQTAIAGTAAYVAYKMLKHRKHHDEQPLEEQPQ